MNKNYYLGIDVSKGYADIIILDKKKNIIEPNFQLDDTFEGHSKLFQILYQLSKRDKLDMIFGAVESTGGYENNWYNSLKESQSDLKIKVARINPLVIYHNSKADLRRVTTDKTSAYCIAEYLLTHPEKVDYDSTDYFADLRRLRGFVGLIKSQKTQLQNMFESLYYETFPEIVRYCKAGPPDWVLKLMHRYPTVTLLSKADPDVISQIPYITLDRAIELIELAKHSVASSQSQITEKLIKIIIEQIISLSKVIDSQIKEMAKELQSPEFDLLKSFPGISDWSAMNLILDIGSIERFSSAKKLAAYFGLNPSFKQSGDGVSKVMMSKQGRVEPRKVLYMVVFSGLTCNPLIQRTFEHFKESGLSPRAAMGACMHKAIRVIYGMLKNNKPYDDNIDLKNQEKHIVKSEAIRDDKNRRYQSFDTKAPISKRQTKKRTAGEQPQNVKNIKCGV